MTPEAQLESDTERDGAAPPGPGLQKPDDEDDDRGEPHFRSATKEPVWASGGGGAACDLPCLRATEKENNTICFRKLHQNKINCFKLAASRARWNHFDGRPHPLRAMRGEREQPPPGRSA